MFGIRVTPLRSVIRTLCASTVGEGLAPPENMNSNHKEREHQGAPLPTPTANANLILRRFASTRVFARCAKIFARGSRERAPIALLAKCEPMRLLRKRGIVRFEQEASFLDA